MNNGDQTADFIYIIGALVLVVSSLLARRIPLGTTLRMLTLWVVIFASAFIVFLLRDDIAGFAHRVVDGRRAESTGVQADKELRISQATDGHFWVNGTLNGQSVRFLIDSGATTTSISRENARRAAIDSSGGIPAVVETANGAIEVERGRADLRIGNIGRKEFAVHVSDAPGDVNVLGMNFLSSLAGCRVEGRTLILTP